MTRYNPPSARAESDSARRCCGREQCHYGLPPKAQIRPETLRQMYRNNEFRLTLESGGRPATHRRGLTLRL